MKRGFLLLVSILMVPLIFPIENCLASGDIIYVDHSNTNGPWNGTLENPYQTIQDGINAANPKDIVYVKSGTYNENVKIGKSLTLTGENKDTTIIDGGKNGHVLYANGSLGSNIENHVSGFTIRNAGKLGYDCIAFSYVVNGNINNNKIINSDESDGIQLDHCSNITINNNIITNNDGGGISMTLSGDNIIHDNTIQNNQKGIYLYYSSNNNQIYQNTITGNSQYGVYIVQSLNNYLYGNDFTDNGQNAQDSLPNYWSYNAQGNYWDDYNGYDNNSDEIGDTPYDIPGGDNQDEHPLGYFKESGSPGGNQKPTAYQPTISPNPATTGETVSFSGSGSDSDGFISGYNWRSNVDGQLSTQSTFTTSTLSTGTHIIYFKVKDNDGDWSSEKTDTLTINCIENQAPTAYIDSINPNPAISGEKIYFIGHGTDDGEIVGWKWISSIDGKISSNKSLYSSVLSNGTHTIYFQVMDNDNEWSEQDAETLTINQGSSKHRYPIAKAGGPYSSTANEQITLNGSASYPDRSIVAYLWDFGDGTTGTGESTIHIYTAPGNYSITLTVTDENGNTSTNSTYITIIQSMNQSSNSEGLPSFELNIPFPLLIVLEFALIIIIIASFLWWIKRK